MSIEELLQPIKGIEPFNELPIDADIWREAHGQHQSHRRLHAVSSHRPGIVWGLEVLVSPTKDRTLLVAPGVAIDSEGRTLVLPEPVSFTLEERGETYIVIHYDEGVDRKSKMKVGEGERYFRLIELRQVLATKELPKLSYLELARIDRTKADKAISEAKNPFDPAEDELNTMHRAIAFPHCYADGGIGDLCLLPKDDSNDWKPNRAGLWNMIHEANGKGFHLSFTGVYNLRGQPGPNDPFILYVAGASDFQPLSDSQLEGLRRYLDQGGTLLAEASEGSEEFVKAFTELSRKLTAKLQPVKKGDSLLTSHHVFPAAPPGRNSSGSLLADSGRGVILSTFDYGAAWQGDVSEKDGRERVRSAQEFGFNLIAWAARRLRHHRLAAYL